LKYNGRPERGLTGIRRLPRLRLRPVEPAGIVPFMAHPKRPGTARPIRKRQPRWIASHTFDCVDAEGSRFSVTASIGEPYMQPMEGEYDDYGCCPTALEPLFAARRVGGNDTFQALCLALHLIRQTLRAFVAQGGRVFFPGTTSPIDLDDPSFCSYPDGRRAPAVAQRQGTEKRAPGARRPRTPGRQSRP
jgi:hypothetical protein